MKFTIVTPCRNAEELIGDTARSIAKQEFGSGGFEIEYIVVDGASTDHTVEALKAAWPPETGVSLGVVSEPDLGMYDALVKGFRMATGDVVSYLNAGDMYSPYAIDTVHEIMKINSVNWLTGMRVTYTSAGALNSAKVPFHYNSADIARGFYGLRGIGRHIQQESTFWRRPLLASLDYDYLRGLRLAGDAYMWTRFASVARLDIVAAHLGGFRFHGGHLSDAAEDYRREGKAFIGSRGMAGFMRAPLTEILSWIPVPLRAHFPRGSDIFCWDRRSDRWARLNEH